MDYAAQFGHLDVVKWLHENRTEGCTTDAMDLAAKNGHLETVKWLAKNRREGSETACMLDHAFKITKAMNWAIIKGRLDIVKVLFKKFPRYVR